MVNPTREQVDKYSKLIAIGPECGITLNSKPGTVIRCISNYLKGRNYTSIPFKLYLRDYLYTNIRRRRLEAYESQCDVRNNYIFHASTLWYNEFAGTDTNRFRGEFLLACQKAGIEIEGGLFYVNGEAPLKREMPEEGLVHGENVHFVETPEDIYDAVVKINSNGEYRKHLEKGARDYYEKWLAPEVVISRIVNYDK